MLQSWLALLTCPAGKSSSQLCSRNHRVCTLEFELKNLQTAIVIMQVFYNIFYCRVQSVAGFTGCHTCCAIMPSAASRTRQTPHATALTKDTCPQCIRSKRLQRVRHFPCCYPDTREVLTFLECQRAGPRCACQSREGGAHPW